MKRPWFRYDTPDPGYDRPMPIIYAIIIAAVLALIYWQAVYGPPGDESNYAYQDQP